MANERLMGVTEYLPPEPESPTLVPSLRNLLHSPLPPRPKGLDLKDQMIKVCADKWTELLQRLPPPPPGQEWWPVTKTETRANGGIYMVITPELRWLPGTPQNPCAPED